MKRTTILVVDDEPRLAKVVRASVESAGYKVLSALNGQAAFGFLKTRRPDLMLLDMLMPDMDGFEVCERTRQFSNIPIIMLAARDEERDRVRGLQLGADDCLTKPVGTGELLARINAVLRRVRHRDEPRLQPTLVCDDLRIEFARRKVFARGSEINLSPTEYRLLCQLVVNGSRVLTHEELLTRVWGPGYRDEIEYLRVYVRYLRQKLEADPGRPEYILSKAGVGYVFGKPIAIHDEGG